MSSNDAATGGLIEALAGHVRELSAEIGERSVLRGDGLERARAYIRGAFAAAGLTVTELAPPSPSTSPTPSLCTSKMVSAPDV